MNSNSLLCAFKYISLEGDKYDLCELFLQESYVANIVCILILFNSSWVP